jgi:hypothetical protein
MRHAGGFEAIDRPGSDARAGNVRRHHLKAKPSPSSG